MALVFFDQQLEDEHDNAKLEIWTADLLARATAASIAYLDTSGLLSKTQITPPYNTTGTITQLKVNWVWVIVTLALLASCEVVMVTLAMFFTRNVVVPDKSILSTAHLVTPRRYR
jgi:hypothetical protein